MERFDKLAMVVLVTAMLASFNPAEAWYKQATGPSYYSVGRASGLLSGIRRSSYIRRAEPESVTESEEFTDKSVVPEPSIQRNSVLKTLPICVKNILPNLQSCEFVQDGTNTFQCKADVLLSLDSRDCLSA